MDWKLQNVKVYDDQPMAWSEYFAGIGPRVKDIKTGLKLAKADKNARVVEIGCGDGRDASEITRLVGWYQGFDPSRGLLNIAKKKLPEVDFVMADALSYDYPEHIDVVYAFASLLHVDRDSLKEVFAKVAKCLRTGGIFYISLKERERYLEEVDEGNYGSRMFYYYNVELIEGLMPEVFKSVFESRQTIGSTDWFTIALIKL